MLPAVLMTSTYSAIWPLVNVNGNWIENFPVMGSAVAVAWMTLGSPTWNNSTVLLAPVVPMKRGMRFVVTLSPTIPVSSAGLRRKSATALGFVLLMIWKVTV